MTEPWVGFHNRPKGWCFKTAKVVRRWQQGWWRQTDSPGALCEVWVLDCYSQPGQNAYLKELPGCAVEPERMKP